MSAADVVGFPEAISAQAVKDASINTRFVVTAWGWSPAFGQGEESAAIIAMSQITAPVPPSTPGQWSVQIDYASKGPKTITVYNNTASVRLKVTSGDAGPAFDPLKVLENSRAGSIANERAKAAAILGVRSHVG